jgi:hypothetical protein
VQTLIVKFYSEVLSCLSLQFTSCVLLADAGNEIVEYLQSVDLACKSGELVDKILGLASWNGLYSVFTNYYLYEVTVNSVIIDMPVALKAQDW